MGRILFWFLLGLVAYFAWRGWSAKQRLQQKQGEENGTQRIGAEPMVPCDVCGLNVPRSEALAGSGRWYCSDDHRKRGSA